MELSWDYITEEELRRLYYDENLSDSQIADLYKVTKSKVAYKRNKFGISIRDKIFQDILGRSNEIFEKINLESKERLLKKDNIDWIAKAITHFAFRNGPVEGMHANRQLSQNDMKILNKYMVNRIAGLLTAIADNRWMEIEIVLSDYKKRGYTWDTAEPDMSEFDNAFKLALKDSNF